MRQGAGTCGAHRTAGQVHRGGLLGQEEMPTRQEDWPVSGFPNPKILRTSFEAISCEYALNGMERNELV